MSTSASTIAKMASTIKWRSSLQEVRSHICRELAVKRVSPELVRQVRDEARRQESVRAERLARQSDIARLPMSERWAKKLKISLVRKRIVRTLTDKYREAAGEQDYAIAWGEPSASGKREKSGWKQYGRKYYPTYTWQTRITIEHDWLRQVERLGTHEVEGHLVIAVREELPTTHKGDEAYRALIVVQGQGSSLKIEDVMVYRPAGAGWRVGTVPIPSVWDRLLEIPVKGRKPPRKRQHAAITEAAK